MTDVKFAKVHYDKVKPCPLCGGYSKLEAKSKTVINGEIKYTTYCRCCDCDCRGPRVLIGKDPTVARKLALERWNRRVADED